MNKTIKIAILLLVITTLINNVVMAQTITGELKKWHKVTLTFTGPNTNEQADPNPFTDYRLNVTFTGPSAQVYKVPGYFAADGDAANTSATEGDKWRCHFAPDESGEWSYEASFRTGDKVALNESTDAGTTTSFDGASGTITISPTDKTGRDHRGKGRLQYVGKHHLQFAETGEYFLKEGADAPENLLAYNDIDGTSNKTWSAHVKDWNDGDPTWKDGKGKGLIGAVNYLASEEMNAFSFLTMNINGDDKNVYPYPSTKTSDRLRIDVSKTAQWEVVFEHGDKMGMYLHFKTQETENDHLLDGGNLGDQRKLYYRELIARFSHHLALNWNLGEENTQTSAQVKDMAKYFHDNDPYQHNIVLHTYPGQYDRYDALTGKQSELTGTSIQGGNEDFGDTPGIVSTWVKKSAAAGKPWVVAVDEPGDPSHAIRPDSDKGNSHEDGRKNALWGTIMNGGAGCEYYFGYSHAHSDLSCQDWRSRDKWWDYCRFALKFFKDNNVPFWDMSEDDSKTSNGWCLAKENHTYVVYFPKGVSATELTVGPGEYLIEWFDPRNGGNLQIGTVNKVFGSGAQDIGLPPDNTSKDWVCLVRQNPEHSIPGRIEAELFSNQQGIDTLILNDTVSVIDSIDHGEFVNYVFKALVGEEFDIDIKVANPVIGTNIYISIDEKLIDTLAITEDKDTLSTSLFISEGIHTLQLDFSKTEDDSNLVQIDWIDLYGDTQFYTIQASAGEGGTIDPSGTKKIKEGEDIQLNFEWEIGYKPDSILIDGTKVASASSHTFTNLTANHTLVANFIECDGSIPSASIKVNSDEYISGSSTTVTELDNLKLKAVYSDENSFYWLDKDGQTSISEEYELEDIIYAQAGIYSTVQINSEGCKDRFDFDIEVEYIELDVYQAEELASQSGLEIIDTCTDLGGTNYVTSIENNDWATYTVNIEKDAIYNLTYRVANTSDGGFIIISLADSNIMAIPINKKSNGEQDWVTTSPKEIILGAGEQDLKFTFKGSSGNIFNFNWFNIEYKKDIPPVTAINSFNNASSQISIYPNPADQELWISSEYKIETVEIVNSAGVRVLTQNNMSDPINVSQLEEGIYMVLFYADGILLNAQKMIKK